VEDWAVDLVCQNGDVLLGGDVDEFLEEGFIEDSTGGVVSAIEGTQLVEGVAFQRSTSAPSCFGTS
jgi:hypothetical protein